MKLATLAVSCLSVVMIPGAFGGFGENHSCEVTRPNGQMPPGEAGGPRYHGNGVLWTLLWPEGKVVFRADGPGLVSKDGSLSMKFPWWRSVPGRLAIEGRRLDAPAPPLARLLPYDRGHPGFLPSILIFPTSAAGR